MTTLSYEERSIEKVIAVEAQPGRVFRALTEADELRGWLVTGGEVEAVPGGRLTLQWANGATTYITFAELDPDGRVIMEWHDQDAPGATLVRIELGSEEDGAGTRLHLTDSGYGSGEAWDRAYGGADSRWDEALAALGSYLEDTDRARD